MKKLLTKLLYGLNEGGEPIDLTFKAIKQESEPLRGDEARQQADKFNQTFNHISKQLWEK